MTKTEVATIINSTGLTWAYSHYSKTPNTPYIVYYYPQETDVHADDINYINKRQLIIELYTAGKDDAAEAAIEAELKRAGISWYKQTDFLNDEKLFQTTYESEVIING